MKNIEQLKKYLLLLMGVAVVVIFQWMSPTAQGVITGSKHDFSAQAWSTNASGAGEICIACHTPHFALSTLVPLWNHATTVATYTLYASPTMNAVVGQPTASSKACLSCHDGTVAVNSFGGSTGTTNVTGIANLGVNLSDDHPVSFTYDTALATADGGLFDPAIKAVPALGAGKTIATGLLIGGKLECASCHDVHNNRGDAALAGTPRMLLVKNTGSALCLTCHNK